MIASKVTFSKQTKEMLNYRPLSRPQRAKLRKRRVLEYIRELPNGESNMMDMIAAAGYNVDIKSQYTTGWAFIDRLVKNKVIGYNDGPKGNQRLKQWYIPSDAKTKPKTPEPAKEEEKPATPKPEPKQLAKVEWEQEWKVGEEPVKDDILKSAKEFAWRQNSDSLREFILWMGY